MKRIIIILLLGIIVTGFSNIHIHHIEILQYINLSLLSFVTGIIIRKIKIKYLIFKILLFIFVPLFFFLLNDILNGFTKSIFVFHLLYLSLMIVFFIAGHFFNFKSKKNVFYMVFFLAVSVSFELFYIPKIIYFSNFVKIETDKIPDFELEDLNGNTVTKEDFKGKVVFFDFWTTTCGYCIKQFPSIYKVAENFKNNPDVLFCLIDYNGKFDDTEYVKKFVKERNIQLPVLIDKKSELSKKMHCYRFPHSFILDKNLNIQYHHAGYNKINEDIYIKDVTNRIKKLLNE